VAGYTTIEKMQIFKRYILKQAMGENGLSEEMQR
jgi:ATP-dependent Lon protease